MPGKQVVVEGLFVLVTGTSRARPWAAWVVQHAHGGALSSLEGRSNWLSGVQLVGAYIVIAAAAFFIRSAT